MNRKLFWIGYLLAIVAIVWVIWRQRKEEIERRLETMRQGGPFAQDWLRKEPVAEKAPAADQQQTVTRPAPEQEEPEDREEREEKAESKEAPKPASQADDLQAISGIGPAFEQRLKDAGITRYEQIASLSADDIREKINLDPWRGDVESWIEQAQRLAAED